MGEAQVEKVNLKDVQRELPKRRIIVKKVGVKSLKWPIKVMRKSGGFQDTVATVNLFVELPDDERGTHMSRFIQLMKEIKAITPQEIHRALRKLRLMLGGRRAYLSMEFPYFIWKEAPVTREISPIHITSLISAESPPQEKGELSIGVIVPVTLLCPCSKAISDRGAHNQRADVRIEVITRKLIWFEDLVQLAEASASAPVYTLLKRPDEKYLTERAYDNPSFVEDVVREISFRLEGDDRIRYYRVEVESYESIHPHNAYACIEGGMRRDEQRRG